MSVHQDFIPPRMINQRVKPFVIVPLIPQKGFMEAHLNLNPQVWAGYVFIKGNKTLVTSDCPQGYCSNTRVKLPNSSHTAFDDQVCPHHRDKHLCGKCQQGYYVYVNSPTYQCGRCNDTISNHGFLILIVSKYVPLTLMMCFIMFFDISLVDGLLLRVYAVYSIYTVYSVYTVYTVYSVYTVYVSIVSIVSILSIVSIVSILSMCLYCLCVYTVYVSILSIVSIMSILSIVSIVSILSMCLYCL